MFKQLTLLKLAKAIIKALLMSQQGFKFYLADNGVWLTKEVPAEFILELE
ncbi:hypothetical protein [Photorhabdus bodei]